MSLVRKKAIHRSGLWLAASMMFATAIVLSLHDRTGSSIPSSSGRLSEVSRPNRDIPSDRQSSVLAPEPLTDSEAATRALAARNGDDEAFVSALLFRLQSVLEKDGSGESSWAELQSILDDLRSHESAAVMKVVDFLKSKDDVEFSISDRSSADYSTLRLLLIEFLRQAGGIEAEKALRDVIDSPLSLNELEAASDALEWLQPGYQRDRILARAESEMKQVLNGTSMHLTEDTAPLFRLFQKYGNERVVDYLTLAPGWQRAYADIALANLPDGIGIRSLKVQAKRELKRSDESRSLQLLAQAAVSLPEAEKALVELAQDGLVPAASWPLVASVFMGDNQLQLENPEITGRSSGSLLDQRPVSVHTFVERETQTIYSVNYSAFLTPSERTARIDLIYRFLNQALDDSANAALWHAYELLSTPGR